MDDPKHHDKDSLPLFNDQCPENPSPEAGIRESEAGGSSAAIFAEGPEISRIPAGRPVAEPAEPENGKTAAAAPLRETASGPEPEPEPETGDTKASSPAAESCRADAENESEAPPPLQAAAPAWKELSHEGIPLGSFGKYLRELRTRNNLKISDLSETTKIRSTYIESIEEEDYDNLPPAVYVLAYLKTIGACYRLPEDIMAHLTAEVRQRLEYEAPEDPSKTIIDEEESEENAILMRKYLFIGGGILLFVVLLLAWLIVALMPGRPATAAAVPAGPELLTEEHLLKLHPEPALELRELPVSAD